MARRVSVEYGPVSFGWYSPVTPRGGSLGYGRFKEGGKRSILVSLPAIDAVIFQAGVLGVREVGEAVRLGAERANVDRGQESSATDIHHVDRAVVAPRDPELLRWSCEKIPKLSTLPEGGADGA